MNQAKKKVLYIITKSNWGGAQRYVFDLANSLPKEKFEAVVAFGGTDSSRGAGRLSEMLTIAGVRTVLIPELTRDVGAGDFSAFHTLLRLLKTEKPDVVHLNSSKAGGVGALAARIGGIKKVIFTVHGLPWDEDRSILWRTLVYCATRATFLFSHIIITVSKDNYDRSRGFLRSRKVRLVHNGIASVDLLASETARQRLGYTSGHSQDIWIGTIAELTDNKNIETALKAFAKARALNPNLLYVIIGDGENKARLLQCAKELDIGECVRFAGHVPNAASLLSAFDIFFLPSKKEGLPYVLLEAGLAGVPVVASNVGGISEIVEPSKGGFLCNSNDVNGFAKALGKLAADETLRRNLGEALKTHVEKEFSLQEMIKQTSALYS